MGSGVRVAQFIVAIAHQNDVTLCEQYEAKINGGSSQISSRHTFKKLSVNAGSRKAKGLFKMHVLVKRQDKLWTKFEQSSLEYLLVHQILIKKYF